MNNGSCTDCRAHSGVLSEQEAMQKNLERMDSEQTKQWDAIEECRRYQNKILYGVALSLLGILGQFVLLFLRRPGG